MFSVLHDLVFVELCYGFWAHLSEENDGINFEYFHDDIWNHESEVLNLIPESQNDGFFQEIKNSVESLKVVDVLVAGLEELLNVISDVLKVLFLLFLLFTLINSFGFVNVLKYGAFLLVSLVPVLYSFDSFYRAEFLIVYIGVMGDSNEGLMDVSLREDNSFTALDRLLILLFEFVL